MPRRLGLEPYAAKVEAPPEAAPATDGEVAVELLHRRAELQVGRYLATYVGQRG